MCASIRIGSSTRLNTQVGLNDEITPDFDFGAPYPVVYWVVARVRQYGSYVAIWGFYAKT